MQDKPTFFIIFFTGIVGLVGSFYTWKRTRRFIEQSQETYGQVIDLVEDSEGGVAPIIRFKTHNGTLVEFTDSIYTGKADAYKVGSSVKIRYNTQNHNDARIATSLRLYIFSISCLIIALGAFFICSFALFQT